MERYVGRVAMVTGASSGIGAAIARALARRGLVVVGVAPDPENIQALEIKDGPGKLQALKGDVTDEQSILQVFKWIKENLGGVDILINNAGVTEDAPLTSAPTDSWKHILDVNVLGLSICTREAVQDMLSRGVDDGFIIHISSIAAYLSPENSNMAMYYASKSAVKTLLEGLRQDLLKRKCNIRAGQICPALVKTNIVSNTSLFDIFDKYPYLEPEDIAEAVVYMLSQDLRVMVSDIIIRPTSDGLDGLK